MDRLLSALGGEGARFDGLREPSDEFRAAELLVAGSGVPHFERGIEGGGYVVGETVGPEVGPAVGSNDTLGCDEGDEVGTEVVVGSAVVGSFVGCFVGSGVEGEGGGVIATWTVDSTPPPQA